MSRTPTFQATEQIIKGAIEHGAFPVCSLLIGRNERVLYQRSFGALPNGDMVTDQTRFDLASLTKPIVTATLTMRALESGVICLWDKLGTFIDAPKDKENITIKQLLTHTAGFTPGLHLWQMTSEPSEVTGLILESPLAFDPGTQVKYACAGYILLGQLLECLYDAPLDELAKREVFWPLKMMKTGYLPVGGNIAPTEQQEDGSLLTGIVHDENARLLGGVAGNAGVFSTAEDISLFVQMLLSRGKLPDGSQYLSRATVESMMLDHTEGLEQARGLGLYLPWYDGGFSGDLFPKESAGHTGFTGTSFLLDPITGLYVVLLCNRICPSRANTDIYRIRRLVHNTIYAACEGMLEAPEKDA